jgi:hypothetical protein
MKLALFAASALIGVASFAPASFAQGDGANAQMSRVPQMGSEATASRLAAPGPAPVLEPSRPPAGMLPPPVGSYRQSSGGPSDAPQQGGNLRNSFRTQ